MNTTAKILGAIAIALVVGFALVSIFGPEDQASIDARLEQETADRELVPSGKTIEAAYLCPSGDTIQTSYDIGANAITLRLPSGEQHVLKQVVSASGARYGTEDESVTFWEHQGKASVELSGDRRYSDCAVVVESSTPATSTPATGTASTSF